MGYKFQDTSQITYYYHHFWVIFTSLHHHRNVQSVFSNLLNALIRPEIIIICSIIYNLQNSTSNSLNPAETSTNCASGWLLCLFRTH